MNAEVKTILQDEAADLGVAGRDSLYGYGLVDGYLVLRRLLAQMNKTEFFLLYFLMWLFECDR